MGNSLEVIEAVQALKGNIAEDVKEVVLELGSNMIKLAGKGDCLEENKNKMLENIKNGKALEKLKELVANQGGDVTYIEDTSKFKEAKYIIPVRLEDKGETENRDGDQSKVQGMRKGETKKEIIYEESTTQRTIKELKAEEVGKLSVFLGAGRIKKEDKIEPEVGITFNKKVGDKVENGDVVAYIHANNEEKAKEAVERLKKIYKLK